MNTLSPVGTRRTWNSSVALLSLTCFHSSCGKTQLLLMPVFPKFALEKPANKACGGRFPCSDMFLPILTKSDVSWPILTCLDLFWPILTCYDLFWHVLACPDLSRLILFKPFIRANCLLVCSSICSSVKFKVIELLMQLKKCTNYNETSYKVMLHLIKSLACGL